MIKLLKELAVWAISLCITLIIFSLFFSIFTLPVERKEVKSVINRVEVIDKKEINEEIYDDDFIYAQLNKQSFCIKNPYLLALGRPPFKNEKMILSATDDDLISKEQCNCLLKVSKQFTDKEHSYTPQIIFKGTTYQSIRWFYPKLGHICQLY